MAAPCAPGQWQTLPSVKHLAHVMSRMLPLVCFTALAVFISGIPSGCSQGANPPSPDDAAAVDALNTWWKESNYSPPPIQAGTVQPAHTITSKQGRVYKVPEHVQTKKEADDEARDALYMEHRRALVRSFSVKGKTVTVLTNLTRDSANILDPQPPSTSDAQTLCQDLGGFVWANPYRHFGLEDIEITGVQGELLSFRNGRAGSCVP